MTVFGHNFRQNAGLSCMFGLNSTVSALFVTSTAVEWKVPTRGPGIVRLSVSNNGADRGVIQTWLEYRMLFWEELRN